VVPKENLERSVVKTCQWCGGKNPTFEEALIFQQRNQFRNIELVAKISAEIRSVFKTYKCCARAGFDGTPKDLTARLDQNKVTISNNPGKYPTNFLDATFAMFRIYETIIQLFEEERLCQDNDTDAQEVAMLHLAVLPSSAETEHFISKNEYFQDDLRWITEILGPRTIKMPVNVFTKEIFFKILSKFLLNAREYTQYSPMYFIAEKQYPLEQIRSLKQSKHSETKEKDELYKDLISKINLQKDDGMLKDALRTECVALFPIFSLVNQAGNPNLVKIPNITNVARWRAARDISDGEEISVM